MERFEDLDAVARRLENTVAWDGALGIGTGAAAFNFASQLATRLAEHIRYIYAAAPSAPSSQLAAQRDIDLAAADTLDWAIVAAKQVDEHGRFILEGDNGINRDKLLVEYATNVCVVCSAAPGTLDLARDASVDIEVTPFARSLVGRRVAAMGCNPYFQPERLSHDQNAMLRLDGLDLTNAAAVEKTLNETAGIVSAGIVSQKPATILFQLPAD
ncbi:MAG: ribose-5-phosphate isomerase A [Gammaproteobacteria bacterium]|nr:ribose-5-phosphate isomerase A [Gammaproteobacteria bacterium]